MAKVNIFSGLYGLFNNELEFVIYCVDDARS